MVKRISNERDLLVQLYFQSVERPLVGGLTASSSWDGGCASRAPPGSGGSFSALPRRIFCLFFWPGDHFRQTTSGRRRGGTAGKVDGLGLLIPERNIAEYMATLQAAPTGSCGRGIVPRTFQGCQIDFWAGSP